MKKILMLLLVLASCAAPRFTIGMTETDFQIQNPGAIVIQATKSYTIYKVRNKTTNPSRDEFYYFENGALVRMDLGKPRPDVIIDKTVHND